MKRKPDPRPNAALDLFGGPVVEKPPPQASLAASEKVAPNPNSAPEGPEGQRVCGKDRCVYRGTPEQVDAHLKYTHDMPLEARYEIRRLAPGGNYVLEDCYVRLERVQTRVWAKEEHGELYEVYDRVTRTVVDLSPREDIDE